MQFAVSNYCHLDNDAIVMLGVLVAAMSYIEPLGIARKMPSKFTIDKGGKIKKEDMSKKTPEGE